MMMDDMQVITGSHDKTVKMWDLRKGKTLGTLTYHKKSVRGLALHPTEYCFASASAENIKKFSLPHVRCCLNMLAESCINAVVGAGILCHNLCTGLSTSCARAAVSGSPTRQHAHLMCR